jgi:uncharacterized protein YegP (UPF0339 family)
MTTRQTRAVGLIGLGALIAAAGAPAAGQEPKPYPKPALTFVVLKDAEKRFHWRLQDEGGLVLAVSDKTFQSKQPARDAVEEVRKLAASDKVRYEFHQDAKMLHRWRLKAGKDRVLAVSGEGYQEKALAEKRAAAVKAGAKDAEVVDKTTN